MKKKPVLVYLESPYAPSAVANLETNLRYLKDCLKDSLARGEAPFASHELYTRALNDCNADERKQGMEAGFAWSELADKSVVYYDLGVSGGMREGISRAAAVGRTIEWRSLPEWANRHSSLLAAVQLKTITVAHNLEKA